METSETKTQYSLTYDEPNQFSPDVSDDGSVIEFSRDLPTREDGELEELDEDLEMVGSANLDSGLDLLVNSFSNSSKSSPNNSSFLRLREATHVKSKKSQETLYLLQTGLDNGLDGVQVFFNVDSANRLFRVVVEANHGPIPCMEGTSSLLEPKQTKRPHDSSCTSLRWDFGFKSDILQRSMRDQRLTIARYTMFGDQKTYEALQTPDKLEGIRWTSWMAISAKTNPRQRSQTMSYELACVATDFYAGREVRKDYPDEPGENEPFGLRRTNYNITLASSHTRTLWKEIQESPAFIRFIMDISICNEIEKARVHGLKWNDAKPVFFAGGDQNESAQINAIDPLETTNFELDEGKASDATSLQIPNVSKIDAHDDQDPSTAERLPGSGEKHKESGSSRRDYDWMKTDGNNESKKGSKKRPKVGKKGRRSCAKKTPSRTESMLGANSSGKPLIRGRQPVNATAALESSQEWEKGSGEWSVVQKKTFVRQNRSQIESSSVASGGGMESLLESGIQSRQAGQQLRELNPNRPTRSDIASSLAPGTVNPLVNSGLEYFPPRSIPLKSKVAMDESKAKSFKVTRTFLAEEYPSLATVDGGLVSKVSTLPLSQGSVPVAVNYSLVAQATPMVLANKIPDLDSSGLPLFPSLPPKSERTKIANSRDPIEDGELLLDQDVAVPSKPVVVESSTLGAHHLPSDMTTNGPAPQDGPIPNQTNLDVDRRVTVHPDEIANQQGTGDEQNPFQSQDSDDETSSIDATSTSFQVKKRRALRSKRSSRQSCGVDSSSEDSPSTMRAASRTTSPTQKRSSTLEAGFIDSEIELIGGDETALSSETGPHRHDPENKFTTDPFLERSNFAIGINISTEEPPRLVSAPPTIKNRSATHTPDGVSIPNFYAEPSEEDSGFEYNNRKARPPTFIPTRVNQVRSATHSEKTRAWLPNFFYLASRDESLVRPICFPYTGTPTNSIGGKAPIAAESTAFEINREEGPSTAGFTRPATPVREMSGAHPAFLISDQEKQEPYSAGASIPMLSPDLASLAAPANFESHRAQKADVLALIPDCASHMSVPTWSLINVSEISTQLKPDPSVTGGEVSDLRLNVSAFGENQNLTPQLHDSVSSFDVYGQPSIESVPTLPNGDTFLVNGRQNSGMSIESSQPNFANMKPYKHFEGQYVGDAPLNARNPSQSRVTSINGNNSTAGPSQVASQHKANCTFCRIRTIPSIQEPQVLCPGCGPESNIRYCCVACLLVDSIAHSRVCMNYSAHRPPFQNSQGLFNYIQNPITSESGYLESPERYRQRAFSMHCSSGAFPQIMMAWMKTSMLVQGTSRFDFSESTKRTGDYVVFRNGVTLPQPFNNPNADIIYTIKFHQDDVNKGVLTRTLNACFLTWDSVIIEFLFRLLRHLILDLGYFSMFSYAEPIEVVWPEFLYQFQKEFLFDLSKQQYPPEALFNAAAEWQFILPQIERLERQNPILTSC